MELENRIERVGIIFDKYDEKKSLMLMGFYGGLL